MAAHFSITFPTSSTRWPPLALHPNLQARAPPSQSKMAPWKTHPWPQGQGLPCSSAPSPWSCGPNTPQRCATFPAAWIWRPSKPTSHDSGSDVLRPKGLEMRKPPTSLDQSGHGKMISWMRTVKLLDDIFAWQVITNLSLCVQKFLSLKTMDFRSCCVFQSLLRVHDSLEYFSLLR